jgi:hypothetical protein
MLSSVFSVVSYEPEPVKWYLHARRIFFSFFA